MCWEAAFIDAGLQLILTYPGRERLAGTPVAVVVDVNVDWVIEVSAELYRLLLSESVSCNNWPKVSTP